MIAALNALARHSTLILPAGLVIGLVWQDLAHLMRPLLAPTVFCMLVTILTRVDLAAALARVRHPAPLLLGVVWAMFALPPLTALVNGLTGLGEGLAFVLIVYAASPPNFAAAGIGYLMGLDGAMCLALILSTVILHPLVAPPAVEFFTHSTLSLSTGELAWRLGLLVGGAILTSALVRSLLGRERQRRLSPSMDGLNVFFMLIFVFALMDGIPAAVTARPGFALKVLGLVYVLQLTINLASVAIFLRFGLRTALAIGYALGGRNIAIVMAALGAAAPADAWLFFALLQFPIYTLPMVMKPLYRRLLAQEAAG